GRRRTTAPCSARATPARKARLEPPELSARHADATVRRSDGPRRRHAARERGPRGRGLRQDERGADREGRAARERDRRVDDVPRRRQTVRGRPDRRSRPPRGADRAQPAVITPSGKRIGGHTAPPLDRRRSSSVYIWRAGSALVHAVPDQSGGELPWRSSEPLVWRRY